MFESLRKSIARAIAPRRPRTLELRIKALEKRAKKPARGPGGLQTRMYQAAKPSRLTDGFGTITTSADSELVTSLTRLRNMSRALGRDASYAKRARRIVQDNVIGAGVGMQAKIMSSRDQLRENVNDEIEEAWEDWSYAENCHTGGTLCFADLERMAWGQIFEAGEVVIRLHRRPFGGSEVPLAVELIEAERLANEFQSPGPVAPGAMVKMGVEVDSFGRPIAYWIWKVHPGDRRFIRNQVDMIERVPAEDIFHLALRDRQPQTRGEPWLHSVVRKLNDMDAYSEAEIIAARANAIVSGTIQSDYPTSPLGNDQQSADSSDGSNQNQVELETGILMKLAPGEKLEPYVPNRPNTALDPFMRYMLREVASGIGVSYESLSKDYSQSNYSSSRLSVLDDRDSWRIMQQWWIRSFRRPFHREWLQAAVLSRAVTLIGIEEYALAPEKFEAVQFKPRGWSWIDPQKDVESLKAAVKAGFTTVGDVVAEHGDGKDLEDVLRDRERELASMKQFDLHFDTSPEVYIPAETKGHVDGDGKTIASPAGGGGSGGGSGDGSGGSGDGETGDQQGDGSGSGGGETSDQQGDTARIVPIRR